MALHKIKTPPPRGGRRIEEMPGRVLEDISVPLFALMNLTWDYIDTVCDLCVDWRQPYTKPLTRRLRTLRRGYDSFRASIVDKEMYDGETARGLAIEERLDSHFQKLYLCIRNEAANIPGLADTQRTLTVAVLQALTLMRAVKIYARCCDKVVEAYGVWVCDCCMVQTEFLELYAVLPKIAPWTAWGESQVCELYAKIIANKIEPDRTSWPQPTPL